MSLLATSSSSQWHYGKGAALVKQADDTQLSYGLAGKLYLSSSGWILLSVPNALVRGAFDALDEPGVELPPSGPGDKLDAHISVIRPEELKEIGGPEVVTERGHLFHYTLGGLRTVTPRGWPEMSKVWMLKVRSPELERLRRSYGLSSKPKEGKFDFHITIGVRKKNVLRNRPEATKLSQITLSVGHDGQVVHEGYPGGYAIMSYERWAEKYGSAVLRPLEESYEAGRCASFGKRANGQGSPTDDGGGGRVSGERSRELHGQPAEYSKTGDAAGADTRGGLGGEERDIGGRVREPVGDPRTKEGIHAGVLRLGDGGDTDGSGDRNGFAGARQPIKVAEEIDNVDGQQTYDSGERIGIGQIFGEKGGSPGGNGSSKSSKMGSGSMRGSDNPGGSPGCPEDTRQRVTPAGADLAVGSKEAANGDLAQARRDTDTSPTEAQIEAGNYRKGKFAWNGLEIALENPKGSTRKGTDDNGKAWSITMQDDYGYIKRTESEADGDHIDVFVGPEPDSELVHIVNQNDPGTGSFDEHKCILGTSSVEAAKEAYLRNYEDGWGGMGEVTAITLPQFKWWIHHGDTSKPIKDGQLAAHLKKSAGEKIPTLAVDLDGTLAKHYDEYDPDTIPGPRPNARKWMKKFQDAGYRLIVFTVRGNTQLVKDWFHEHDIPYDYVNENPDQPPDASGKVFADVYADDRGVDAKPAWDKVGPLIERRLKAAEAYQEDSPSTFTHQGSEYDLNTLLTATRARSPQIYPMSELDWVLNHATADSDRVEAADPDIPGLVHGNTVVDGLHRLAKAQREGRSSISGVPITDEDLTSARLQKTAAEAAEVFSNDEDYWNSPPNKEGRRCPGCNELFKEVEPLPGVEMCETCERFGPSKEAAASDLPYRDRAEMFAMNPAGSVLGGIYQEDRTHGVFGGGVDPGEDPAQAAARELKEESGYSVDNPRMLGLDPVVSEWGPIKPDDPPNTQERKKQFRGSRTFFTTGDIVGEPGSPVPGEESHLEDIRLRPLRTAIRLSQVTKGLHPELVRQRREALRMILAQLDAQKTAAEVCAACGGSLQCIRSKLVCSKCGRISEGCCEGEKQSNTQQMPFFQRAMFNQMRRPSYDPQAGFFGNIAANVGQAHRTGKRMVSDAYQAQLMRERFNPALGWQRLHDTLGGRYQGPVQHPVDQVLFSGKFGR